MSDSPLMQCSRSYGTSWINRRAERFPMLAGAARGDLVRLPARFVRHQLDTKMEEIRDRAVYTWNSYGQCSAVLKVTTRCECNCGCLRGKPCSE